MQEGVDGAGSNGKAEVVPQEVRDLLVSEAPLPKFANEVEVRLQFRTERLGGKFVEELAGFRIHGELLTTWCCEGSGEARGRSGGQVHGLAAGSGGSASFELGEGRAFG